MRVLIISLLLALVFSVDAGAQEAEEPEISSKENEASLELEPLILPTRSEEDWEAMKRGELVPGSSLMGIIALRELFSETGDKIEIAPEVLQILKDEQEEYPWPVEIDEVFAGTYFEKPASAFFIDPQSLLTERDYLGREGFLSDHAKESVIDLYVYLFDGKQDIPSSESPHSVLRNFFSDRGDVAVVFYHLGRPDRTQIAYSIRIHRGVDSEERQAALQQAIEVAGEKSEATSQLESFLLTMSGRLYNMEGKLPPRQMATDLLAELESLQDAKEKPTLMARIPEAVKTLFATVGFIVFLGGAGFLVHWYTEERRVYEFPGAEGSTILDAPHAAGVGGVLSYASASNPPSLQKNQVADYLQRL